MTFSILQKYMDAILFFSLTSIGFRFIKAKSESVNQMSMQRFSPKSLYHFLHSPNNIASSQKSNVVSLLPMQSKRLLMPNSNALMRSVNLSSSRRSLANWFHKIPMMSQQKNCLSVLKKKKLNGKPCRRPTAKPKSNWRYLSIKDA